MKKRPQDKDYRNQETGTLTYLYDLEKFCDHVVSQNKDLIETLERIKSIEMIGTMYDTDRLRTVNAIVTKALKTIKK